MKKTISLVLALVMCLSLCACGGNKSDNGNMGVNVPAIYIGTPKTVDSKVEFDNLVLAENDIAKIMLVEFYVDKLYGSGNSDGAKCASFKVENKTEHEMSVWVTPYLDNERISLANIEGSSTIEAGRVGRLGYYFTFGEYPNATDLESIEDLYDLEFTFELKDMSNFENYKVNCSVADALNGKE